MNDQQSTSGPTSGDEREGNGSEAVHEPTTEAEREGIVDQQGALLAEMNEQEHD